jgi:signal recognition particle receptor subunit beta
VADKTTTTVALDFGRITIDQDLKLYLFGTPGQDRFGFMWRDLAKGALGALVIVDARRINDCYAAVDYFERINLPFVVAVNTFNGALTRTLDDIRWALAIDDDVPLLAFDARDKQTARRVLLSVLYRSRDQLRKLSKPVQASQFG